MDGVIIGGDRRSACLTELLSDRWVDVSHFLYTDLYDYSKADVQHARFVVLPANFLGGIVAGKYQQIAATDVINDMGADCILFCGHSDEVMETLAAHKNIRMVSFLGDEMYLYANAQLTAEGALMRCIETSEKSLFQAHCIIIGSGRIAKALCPLLMAFTPSVTICARNRTMRERFYWQGIKAVDFSQAAQALTGANWVFNTVPYPCIDPKWLVGTAGGCGYMELASAPYGIKREQMPSHMEYRLESGLPGRISPQSAAQVMLSSMERNWEDHIWTY